MKKPSRNIVALILTVIYTLIIMGPLALLALKSPRVAFAVTGECSGNCDICGCSAERRASRTCCCWQKKLKQEHDLAQAKLPDCCKKKLNRGPALTCNCPCGNKKLPGLTGAERTEVLPYRFTEEIVPPDENALFSFHGNRLTDRHGEPPDPPPKLHLIS